MMLVKNKSKQYVTAIAGVRRKTLAVGEKSLLGEFVLEAGAILPPHAHPHEQIGYLVSGALDFIIDGQEYSAKPGDSWVIPGNVAHTAKALETSVAIEVFVPVREDYRD
ncbi:MAG: Cupin domain containing protein [Firmicutes bacterium]|nr:Cupin domain containing protein [Bacillota bacterium]